MTTVEEVMAEVDQLRKRLEFDSAAHDDPVASIKNAIEEGRREWLTSHTYQSDGVDGVRKWFEHHDGSEFQDSDHDVHAIGDYLVVRSEMHSEKKKAADTGPYDDGAYHAVWVVGEDPANGVFVFRANWEPHFEDPEYNWSNNDISRLLGVSAPFRDSPDDTPIGQSLHLAENISIGTDQLEYLKEQYAVGKLRSYLEDHFGRELIPSEPTPAVSIATHLPDIDEYPKSLQQFANNGHELSVEVEIHADSTEELKEAQAELGIHEMTIRRQQPKHWDKLSLERRTTIITEILETRHRDTLLFPRDERAGMVEQARREAENELEEQAGVQKSSVRDFTFELTSATDTSDLANKTKSPNTLPKYIIVDESKLEVATDGNTIRTITLPECGITPRLIDGW